MPYFVNLFDQEFVGSFPLGDRQYNITWKVPANKCPSGYTYAWNDEPYNFSVTPILIAYVSIDRKNFSAVTLNIAGATASATTAQEVVDKINNDATFSQWFRAEKVNNSFRIYFKKERINGRYFFFPQQASFVLGLNKKAGVAELPTYFRKYLDQEGTVLQELDATDTSTNGARAFLREMINNPSFTASNLKSDYELLAGRSGLFTFKKTTADGSNRPSVVIEYPAGAKAGDFAKRITYKYVGATTTVAEYTEEPYTLQSGDLIIPVA